MIVFAWAWAALLLQGAAAGATEAPPLAFEGLASLEAWAEESTFGGGHLYSFDVGLSKAARLFCADRSHTSGIPSSELALFVEKVDDDGRSFYALALYLPVKLGVSRHARIEGTMLFIDEHSMETDAEVEMKVPVSMLVDR